MMAEPFEEQATSEKTLLRSASHNTSIENLILRGKTEGGFGDDETRQRIWPALLGACARRSDPVDLEDWISLPEHRDESQVALDVARTINYRMSNQTEKDMDAHKLLLSDLIISVLRSHPNLCYFQGFHDIAQVFLLVLGPVLARACLTRLSLIRIRDFMLPSLAPALAQLDLLKPVLRKTDFAVFERLSLVESHFALAAILTLYSHDLEDYDSITRLFDAFLVEEACFPIYLFVSIISENRQQILDVPEDEPEILHVTLSKLPKPTNLDESVQEALRLLELHSPDSLSTWRRISPYSTMRTCRSPREWITMTEDQANELFLLHQKELEKEVRYMQFIAQLVLYRRPLLGLGLATAVGILAIVLGARR